LFDPADSVLQDFVSFHVSVDDLLHMVLGLSQYLGDLPQRQFCPIETGGSGPSEVMETKAIGSKWTLHAAASVAVRDAIRTLHKPKNFCHYTSISKV
jgi:hypothetical protein